VQPVGEDLDDPLRKAAPFILVSASREATWTNFETRSIARNMRSLPWVGRGSRTSMWT
jgi:hypothetical protein